MSDQTTTIDPSAPVVRDHIISLLNLEYLPDAEKAELLDKMVTLVNQRVFLRVLDSFDEQKKEHFLMVMDSGTDVQVQEFVIEHVPDYAVFIAEETIVLKQELMIRSSQSDSTGQNNAPRKKKRSRSRKKKEV